MKLHWYLAEIAAALEAVDAADPDLLGDSAVAYADACHAANDRLATVDALLSRGLRSEAIGLADVEPPLLDEVGALDFPARGDWVQLLIELGMQPPPPLDAEERAATLNAAYAQEAQVQPLLDKHRLLALGRAPLSARLSIARQLRRADPENPCWPEEVERYEAARFEELSRELNEGARAGDAGAVEAVANELRSAEWSLSPPKALVARANETAADLGAVRARWELEELLKSLETAYGELDAGAIAPMTAEWRRLAVEARLSPSDPLAERAAPAIEWSGQQQQLLAEERAYERSLQQLESALDQGADAATLERAYSAAVRFERPLPELLEQRAVNRLDSFEQWRRRRLVAGIGSAAFVLVACFVAGGLWAWRAAHQAEVALHVDGLSDLLEANSLEAAEGYVEKLSPTLSQEPELVKLVTETRSRVGAEKVRVEAFSELLRKAEQMDPANPDRVLLNSLLSQAVTDEEKRRARVVQAAVADADNRVRREREGQLAVALKAWATRLGELDRSLRKGERMDETTRRTLVNDATAELTGFPGVSSDYRTQAAALVTKARTLIDFERQLELRLKELDLLAPTVGDVGQYVDRLNRFSESYPNAPESPAIKRIAGAQAWKSVVEWSAFWEGAGHSLADLSPAQAASLLAKGREKLPPEATPNNPLALKFRASEDYLDRIAKRPASLEKLRGWLREPLFNVWAVAKKDGDIVYSAKPPLAQSGTITFERFVDVMKGTAAGATREATWHGLAPHAAFCQAVLQDLDNNPSARWESRFAKYCNDLLKKIEGAPAGKTPPINPLVALDIFRRLLLVGGEGSGPFVAATGPMFEKINTAPLDFMAPWYLEGDKRGEAAMAAAVPLLPTSPDFRRTLQKAAAEYERLRASTPSVLWVGFISGSSGAPSPIRLRNRLEGDGRLVVVDDATGDFSPVGVVIDGNVRSETAPKAPTGTPVFLVRDSE